LKKSDKGHGSGRQTPSPDPTACRQDPSKQPLRFDRIVESKGLSPTATDSCNSLKSDKLLRFSKLARLLLYPNHRKSRDRSPTLE